MAANLQEINRLRGKHYSKQAFTQTQVLFIHTYNPMGRITKMSGDKSGSEAETLNRPHKNYKLPLGGVDM